MILFMIDCWKVEKLNFKDDAVGFTLVELLVAVVITGIVITIVGSGLISILSGNQKAEAQSNLRIKLDYALSFIADDIRESNQVSTSVPPSWTGWTIPVGYSGVLFLTKSGGEKVAYYTRQKSSSATTPVWQGPEIIYRATVTNAEGDTLVDSIQTGGFPMPTLIGSRQATLSLTGQACIPPSPGNICTNPQSLSVSTQAFARSQ
jgi:prepilin-type N-terminal cleavage/methylation domain-containing protein